MTDIALYLCGCLLLIMIVPWATKQSELWLYSFRQFQEEEALLMLTKQQIIERIQEWKEVADRIERGEHPYNNLSDALTQQFGEFARGMVKHLQHELSKLETPDDAK